MFLTIAEIDNFIKEDVPYIDLTSHILGIKEQAAEITYFTRRDAVVCGTEEVSMIFRRLNIKTENLTPSGTFVKAGAELISGVGRGDNINTAWKVGQNILDSCSGIATKTRTMVNMVRAVNPNISVLTTRKIFPGTKSLAVKSAMAGGAMPHRLGLSETVLIFKQHIDFIGGFQALLTELPSLKAKSSGKKILVETSDFEEARLLCEKGICGIQFDKVKAADLKKIMKELKKDYPYVILLATGGINLENAAEYAETGVDGLVTTNLYHAPPVDIGVKINAIQ